MLAGISTRREHAQEILDELRPVPRALIDLDRHRKLIRERVIPPPRGVRVEWIDCGHDDWVLIIDVPVQPPACPPYAVPGPTRRARLRGLPHRQERQRRFRPVLALPPPQRTRTRPPRPLPRKRRPRRMISYAGSA